MIIKLTDGSDIDVDDVSLYYPDSDPLEVHLSNGNSMFLSGEDRLRVRCVLKEHTTDGKDITPDDIAHIDHPGMSFSEMLRFFRGV